MVAALGNPEPGSRSGESRQSRYTEGDWYLEGSLGQGRTWSVCVEHSPFLIGRHDDSHLQLTSNEISRRHAEIVRDGDSLWIRDLGSTNGTFHNHERLECRAPLRRNDVLHFGSLEFRVAERNPARQESNGAVETGVFMAPPELPDQFVRCGEEFEQLLTDCRVLPVYQPIVDAGSGRVVGYELLGRGDHPELPTAPVELFQIAERLGKAAELSRLFRDEGLRIARDLPVGVDLLFNEHPAERLCADTVAGLKHARNLVPEQRMILEINERTVTDLQAMRELRCALDDLGIGLAYDDFGAGQARLRELIEVPPDYLKFDAFLIRDLDRQSDRFHRALQTLVDMSHDLGVIPLAEGVETEAERAICESLGFEAIQGHLYGRPVPFPELRLP